MTTRRTFLATAAAAAVCPPLRAQAAPVEIMVPVTELWFFGNYTVCHTGAQRVLWSEQADFLSWEPVNELPFVPFPSPNDAVIT